MTGDKRDFNTVAKTWDENPGRVKLAADVGRGITDTIPLTPGMDVLDFGLRHRGLTLSAPAPCRIHHRCLTVQRACSPSSMKRSGDGNLENVKTRNIDLYSGDVLTGKNHLHRQQHDPPPCPVNTPVTGAIF